MELRAYLESFWDDRLAILKQEAEKESGGDGSL